MHPEVGPVNQAVEKLQARFGDAPPTAIVLGSGLGKVTGRAVLRDEAPHDALGLPQSGVAGHAGKVMVGTLGGGKVCLLSGRVHLYEGHSAQVVVRAVRALHQWGVKRLVLTASVGGIRERLNPGSLVLVDDHINLQHDNPLTGPTWGSIRFPDLTNAYDLGVCNVLEESARKRAISLPRGVYAAMSGPAYETPAEIRMLRTVGADVVGMSTVPEILAAVQAGLPAAAIAVVSNRAAGLSHQPLTHEEVQENANQVAGALADLLEEACSRFDV